MSHPERRARLFLGFTPIQIAIVLLIVGLLFGGVLKGQELITSARVRHLVSQQEGIKAAFFGFQDRFRARPGDYAAAARTLRCGGAPTCLNGNGNGVIETSASPAADSEVHEEILVWMHLTSAGFLNGSYTMNTGEIAATDANTPKNPYNIYLQITYDTNYTDIGTPVARHSLKTGASVPVEIIAEVDRKIDDGNGARGAFRYSTYAGNAPVAPATPAGAHVPGQCMTPTGFWFIPQGEVNCGGASLL